MIRGEFISTLHSGDEHVVPNQFTHYGVQLMLKASFQKRVIPNLWVGLCAHNPVDQVALALIQEPTIGVSGYQRQAVPPGLVDWPTVGLVNGEAYIETREFTFALNDEIDVSVNRLFITDGTQVLCISSAFEEGLQYLSTPKSTRYRLYLR